MAGKKPSRRTIDCCSLIHNTCKQDISFHNQKLTYSIHDKIFAEHTFSPPITIEKQTSMPWTFIFPVGSFNINEEFSNGILKIEGEIQ
ncbi:SLAP domain-containing protein [Virgibacillus profundi]|uniref:SLAP domain-containing protein n=1 Tax=Virgibacillus profundi TaxID=2024555 RepID=UPI0013FD86F0